MPAQQSDGEIIAASLSDPRRFGEIFELYYDPVFSYLQRRLGRTVGEDLTSETFAQAFEHRARFDVHRSALPWLLGIGTNLLHGHVRHERAQLTAYEVAGGAALTVEELDIDERLDAERLVPVLVRGLATIPPVERDALLLSVWAELTYPQVAEAQGVPTGTVRSRINRARGRLRELIGAHLTRTGEGREHPHEREDQA